VQRFFVSLLLNNFGPTCGLFIAVLTR